MTVVMVCGSSYKRDLPAKLLHTFKMDIAGQTFELQVTEVEGFPMAVTDPKSGQRCITFTEKAIEASQLLGYETGAIISMRELISKHGEERVRNIIAVAESR